MLLLADARLYRRFRLYSGDCGLAWNLGPQVLNSLRGVRAEMPTSSQMYDDAIRLRDAGDLEGAAKKLFEIESQDPQHVLTHSALAVILQKLKRFDEAIAHALKVTELEPNDPFSFTQLSVICQRCGKILEAEDAMAKARMMQGGHRH